MKRFQAKNLQTARSKAQTSHQPIEPIIETDEATLSKLLSGDPYQPSDIQNCARKLFQMSNYDFDQFRLVEKIENFESFDVDLELSKPIFVIFGKPKNRWVLFCLIKNQDQVKMLYKDPCGALVSFRLERKISTKFPGIVLDGNKSQEIKEDDDGSYGPLTLRNLKIVLNFFRKNPENFEKKFSEIKFAQIKDLSIQKLTKVAEITQELGKSEEFKRAFKALVDNMPLDLCLDMFEYTKILKEEGRKEDIDFDKIAKAKKAHFTEDNVRQLQEDCKKFVDKTGNRIEDYQLDIEKNFPEEMKKVDGIFRSLENLTIDEEFYAVLQNICTVLDIDYNKLRVLYELRRKKPKKKGKKTHVPLGIDFIQNEIQSKNQNRTKQKKKQNEECSLKQVILDTPLDKILQEITLGKDGEKTSTEEISRLERQYNLVKTKYEKYKDATLTYINQWAKMKRGNLKTTENDICETIAIMDRTLKILNGWNLRIPQILSVLIFLDNRDQKGKLCQIQTGEGKTVIIAIIATFKVLQKNLVDVITSNTVLATEGMEENKYFYSVFDATVATNNPGDDKICYKADVVYGTISNFQFDFLRENFEGFEGRKQRRFDQVILDEVDSMLVDNGGHIAKISSPFPGMECFRYIYIKIWQELQKAEDNYLKETQKKIEEILKSGNINEQELEEAVEDRIKSERNIIKEKIKQSKPLDLVFFPKHLKDFAERKIDIWIKNAIYAKYSCHEHQQYRIILDEDEEEILAPVDYMNTGVTMRNTIWSNGLHQFIQLKHNLRLTYESLTSSFISNIGYIRKYKNEKIFGMTGTLGSVPEQDLLSHIYEVNYAKIPTYKMKSFQELPDQVLEDDEWASGMALEILEKLDEGRAVLVICETEEDLLTIKDNLEIFSSDNKKLRIYANEDNVNATKNKVNIGDVILATNIAGRGTNFKTEKCLEANGGLHVCVGFLPYNLRVESQAFGRTSRQGNTGTARLIIRRSEVPEFVEDDDFVKIKIARDQLEAVRLEQVDKVLVKEIIFKDEIFKYFCDYQRKWKMQNQDQKSLFVLKDLREFWAFWLDKKNFNSKNIKRTSSEEFQEFKKAAEEIINGRISHNPFYSITLAEYLLDREEVTEALNELERVDKQDLLAGANIKLFEIAIINGCQLSERLKNALRRFLFIPTNGTKAYQKMAKKQLIRAQVGIQNEIIYLNNLLNSDDLKTILTRKENNFFLKHLNARSCCLQLHEKNIAELLIQNESYDGVDIQGKAPTTLEIFKDLNQNEVIVSLIDLKELHLVGIDNLYSLTEVHDVSEVVLRGAQAQIVGGLLALSAGIAFLPIFPIMQPIGITLICDGIIDIVVDIIEGGNSEFDLKDYLKDKFISYAIDFLSFGISKLIHCVKIIKAAVKFCRKLSKFLEKCTHLRKISSKLVETLTKLEKFLEGKAVLAKFTKLKKTVQLEELRKLQVQDLEKFNFLGGMRKLKNLEKLEVLSKRLPRLKLMGKKLLLHSVPRLGKTLTERYLIRNLFNRVFETFHKQLKENLKNQIRSDETLVEKIRTTPKNEIVEAVNNYLKTNEAREICLKIGKDLLKKIENGYVQLLVYVSDMIKINTILVTLKTNFVKYLNNHIHGGDANNNVEDILENICGQVADKQYSLFYEDFKTTYSFGENMGKKKGYKMLKNKLNKTKQTKDTTVAGVPSPIKPPENSLEAHYEFLGLQPGATITDAKREYRKLVKQFHPDGNSDPENLHKLQTAYQAVLPKENVRKYYKILNLRMDATVRDTKIQYRKMAMEVHPSRHEDDPENVKKFHKLKHAYKKITADLEGRAEEEEEEEEVKSVAQH